MLCYFYKMCYFLIKHKREVGLQILPMALKVLDLPFVSIQHVIKLNKCWEIIKKKFIKPHENCFFLKRALSRVVLCEVCQK